MESLAFHHHSHLRSNCPGSYLYGTELRRALERNAEGTAKVIPIIIRPLVLSAAPFKRLSRLPTNGEAVTSWSDSDAAWSDVVRAIRHLLEHAGAIHAQSVAGPRSAATPILGLSAASTFEPPRYPYGPTSTGPRSGIDSQHRQSWATGSGWGTGSTPQDPPGYNSRGSVHQTGVALRSTAGGATGSSKAILTALLAGTALLMLAGVILSSVLGSRDEGGCRAPVPETRRVDPPARHVSGALRSAPAITSRQIDEVPRGAFVTVMSAGRGSHLSGRAPHPPKSPPSKDAPPLSWERS